MATSTMDTYPQNMQNSTSALVASFAGASLRLGTLDFPGIAGQDRKISVMPAPVVWPETTTFPQIQDNFCTLQQPIETMFIHSSSSSTSNRINIRTSCPECPRWCRSLRRSPTLHPFPHPCSRHPSAARRPFLMASTTAVPLQAHGPRGE